MVGTTVGSYRITAQLAVGGMGEVYVGQHVLLGRVAAVKMLRDDVSRKQNTVDRFFREAKTTAALAHPGIVKLFDFGYHNDGRAFLIMELLEGEPLRARLQRHAVLPLAHTLYLMRHVCSALRAAHDSHIIHRDLKPDNIFLVPDPGTSFGERPKLLDFGIAKLEDTDHDSVMTRTGMLLGTPAYMAPEQCSGSLHIDHRADLYSLGCIFYEMVCGQRPFAEVSAPGALIGMHQYKVPVRPHEIIPSIHPELEDLLLHLLEKKPHDRPQSTGELMRRIAEIEAMGLQLPPPETYISDIDARTQESTDTTDTVVLESSLNSRRHDSSRVSQQRTAVEMVTPCIPSIGVLPLRNMSADADQQYFCDGITEDIINNLAHLDGLRVAARTSSFAYRDYDQDVREVGRELGTDTLLKGSLRKAGDRLRVTVQLFDVADGFAIWSERYDCEVKDVFDVQDEISKSIVESLEVELSRAEERVMAKQPATKDPEAYSYYLQGKRFFYQFSRNSMIFAREMYEQAIAKDPGYALAYSGIAGCCSWIYMYLENDVRHVEQAIAASQKAIELDPELAEAHVARGLAVSLVERYAEAERELREALRLDPKLFEAYYFYARTCFVQGRMEDAAMWFERASQVNPDNYQSLFILGRVYRRLGRTHDYHRVLRRGIEVAERHLRRNPDDVRAIYLSGQGVAELGDPERGLEMVKRALVVDPEDPVTIINMCGFLSLTGKHDAAIPFLDKALANGFSQLRWLEHDSCFDPIRHRQDYKDVIEKWRRRKRPTRERAELLTGEGPLESG